MKKTLQIAVIALLCFPSFALAQEISSVYQEADLPENARPGECYARVLIPERYDTRSERVLVRESLRAHRNRTSRLHDS